MHFFIKNLLYYIQVDVVDSEHTSLLAEIQNTNDIQAILKAHRVFLANLLKLTLLDDSQLQDAIERMTSAICVADKDGFVDAEELHAILFGEDEETEIEG